MKTRLPDQIERLLGGGDAAAPATESDARLAADLAAAFGDPATAAAVDPSLAAAWLDGGLSEEERDALTAALAGSAGARGELAAAAAMVDQVKTAAGAAPEHLIAQARARFAVQAAAAPAKRSSKWPIWAAAAAVLVLAPLTLAPVRQVFAPAAPQPETVIAAAPTTPAPVGEVAPPLEIASVAPPAFAPADIAPALSPEPASPAKADVAPAPSVVAVRNECDIDDRAPVAVTASASPEERAAAERARARRERCAIQARERDRARIAAAEAARSSPAYPSIDGPPITASSADAVGRGPESRSGPGF